MAYSDYGAFVWKNGIRQRHLEDTNCKFADCVHGLIDTEEFQVLCYKQGLPVIFRKSTGESLEYYDRENVDKFEFLPFDYEIDGYEFHFENRDKPYVAIVITPYGDDWRCAYDYCYGAGFEEDE